MKLAIVGTNESDCQIHSFHAWSSQIIVYLPDPVRAILLHLQITNVSWYSVVIMASLDLNSRLTHVPELDSTSFTKFAVPVAFTNKLIPLRSNTVREMTPGINHGT